MTDPGGSRAHITVTGRAEDRDFHAGGGRGEKVREVDRRAHGGKLRGDLATAFSGIDEERDATLADDALTLEELQAAGTILVLTAADNDFPLRLDSLEQFSTHRTMPRRPKWLLLNVQPGTTETPETAVIWVSDEYRTAFLKLFEDFLEKETQKGNPKNAGLVANIATIQRATLEHLWRSDGEPPKSGTTWWELWLRATPDALELITTFAYARQLRIQPRTLTLSGRLVVWIEASWDVLQVLPFTSVPLTELRRPEFVDTIEDLSHDDQTELASDLAARTTAAATDAPAVCHLDSGVRRSHVLLAGSLAQGDAHSVVDTSGDDTLKHGTLMAGLALYGGLEGHLLGSDPVVLTHRLESVKILPDPPASNDPVAYGLITAQAAATVEIASARQRAFCMPVTVDSEGHSGEPTLWSAAVDALSVGTDIGQSDSGIELINAPDPEASRLFVVSAGNTSGWNPNADYLDHCDVSSVQDPAQAWNALTVGACTDMTSVPSDPAFAGWQAWATAGELSPHSRTSVPFTGRRWPIKPDVCMEGGNVLTNGVDVHDAHPLLSLCTTSADGDSGLTSANATSAATAQAARLAAKIMSAYPAYWPETVRGLMTHEASWTPSMKAHLDATASKTSRLTLLRRYGWGAPTEESILTSSSQTVTMVTQDEFVPFEGNEHKVRRFRLHRLPWPAEALQELGAADVELRVTLSYFIEPNASRRGWRSKYAYASHSLRFELMNSVETEVDFMNRINRAAGSEEAGAAPASGSGRWYIGPNQRTLGSLHQDVWIGSGAELARCDLLAVYPVGGWWKNNKRTDRADRTIRYSLLLSLRTAETTTDLYTPIAVQLKLPIETAVDAT